MTTPFDINDALAQLARPMQDLQATLTELLSNPDLVNHPKAVETLTESYGHALDQLKRNSEQVVKGYLAKLHWRQALLGFEARHLCQHITLTPETLTRYLDPKKKEVLLFNETITLPLSFDDVFAIEAQFETYFEVADIFYCIDGEDIDIDMTPQFKNKLVQHYPQLNTGNACEQVVHLIAKWLATNIAQDAYKDKHWFRAISLQNTIKVAQLELRQAHLTPNMTWPPIKRTGFNATQ